MLTASQQLWSAVVLSDHLKGHGGVAVRFDRSGEAKVTYLEKTVTVDQQVAWFEVAVDDAG